MSAAELALMRIENILGEIEHLDAATNGQFREATDREAFDVASRIERQMLASEKSSAVV